MSIRPPRLRRLGGGAWLALTPSSRARAVTLGTGGGAAVLVHDGATPKRSRGLERALLKYVARHHVARLLQELRVNVVLDVGANRGQFAERLRSSGYQGRIVSYEPVAEHVKVLRRRAAADDDWLVHDHALGEEDGETSINVIPGSAISSLLDASEFGKSWSEKMRHSHTETIRVRRLQDVLDEATAGVADPRVFLKLDTQGFDLQAFRGGGDRVGELVGLQSEVSCVPIYDGMPRMAEQLTAYEQAGFAATGMFPVSVDRPTLRVIEFDVVMIGPRALAERRVGTASR